MSLATPELQVTNIGLEVASVANPQGPFIHIVGFRIGSAFGYVPDASQTKLQGAELFSGRVLAWNAVGNGTLDIIVSIPPEAGPFQFGEVGLYLADANGQFSTNSALFAIGVFDDPQTKFSSLGTNVLSSYTFHCLLKLEQSVAVFQIDTEGPPPAVVDVYQWSDVYPPGISANPDVMLLNVRELNEYGDSTLLQNATDATWSVGTQYSLYQNSPTSPGFVVANASNSWIEIPASALHTHDLTTVNRRNLIRTADGFFRSVSSVQQNGANYRFNLNVTNDGTYNNYPLPNIPQVGSTIYIFKDNARGGEIYYNQIIDPSSTLLAQPGVPGLATSGDGLIVSAPGVMSAYGLLHSPGPNTGRFLQGSDDLNNVALPSGLYTCYWNGPLGNPRNTPADQDPSNPQLQTSFHLIQICPERGQGTNGGSITQWWYPTSPVDGGATPWWRQCASGSWGRWYSISVNGKQGSGSNSAIAAGTGFNTPGQITRAVLNIPSAGTWNIGAWGRGMTAVYFGATLSINGQQVSSVGSYGDSDGIGFNTMWGALIYNASGPIAINVDMYNAGNAVYGDTTTLAIATKV